MAYFGIGPEAAFTGETASTLQGANWPSVFIGTLRPAVTEERSYRLKGCGVWMPIATRTSTPTPMSERARVLPGVSYESKKPADSAGFDQKFEHFTPLMAKCVDDSVRDG